MTGITVNDISPCVRFAQTLNISDGSIYGTQIAYDNRLFLCIDGDGIIIIDGASYSVSCGTLIMWKNGLQYSYHPKSGSQFKLIGVNFDFTGQSLKNNAPIVPAKLGEFVEENVTENIHFTDIIAFNSPLIINEMLYFKTALKEIINEYTCKKQFYNLRCNNLFTDVILQLARYCAFSSASSKLNREANKIIEYIQQNYDKDISNTHLSEVFNYHPSYIGKLIIKATGLPTHQYLINCRVSNAIGLLQSGEVNVSQAAFLCGFNSIAHFSKCIKEHTGYPPSHFMANV